MTKKKLYGLIGQPLGHSFSKDFFGGFFAEKKIDAEYRNFELPDIGDLMELLSEYPELEGLNVTSPYKLAVLPYCDALTEEARETGAVNCMKIEHSGDDLRITGHNTDCGGFSSDIMPFISDGENKEALVLGTGGASRAIIKALGDAFIKVRTVSRTQGQGDLTYEELTDAIVARASVIVNCTPLGMHPRENECPPFPYDYVKPAQLCYDLIYNPCPTLFMNECARRGAAVKGGLGMLINQALLSWKFWNS